MIAIRDTEATLFTVGRDVALPRSWPVKEDQIVASSGGNSSGAKPPVVPVSSWKEKGSNMAGEKLTLLQSNGREKCAGSLKDGLRAPVRVNVPLASSPLCERKRGKAVVFRG
ncbi:hypothetical protein DQ04_13741010 [Trypanosoma grayi]|uniref:hypothetical protein n=1 Tax=Trypanosoma grayi TaxID=71804 RepID=UPI0004F3F1E9|nr:hypothetical protein DQ04_13741010 [Trypanosoma grayi]KEG06476.1 hypothetical protein DQ04_13741010 [Trypanosoma grayi]